MYKIVHNLVDFDRNALITVRVHLLQGTLLKLYKPTIVYLQLSHIFFQCDVSAFRIKHLHLKQKAGNIQLNIILSVF